MEGIKYSLNSVRETATDYYKKMIPEIDENTGIESISAPLFNNPQLFNEFCDVLIQRIVYTQFESKMLNNPLADLEGDELPLGYLGQELYVNPAVGRDYDINDFAGALKKYESDTKVQYEGINFDKQYPVTVVREKIKQAFVTWNALGTYVSELTNSLYNGLRIDQYISTKSIVTQAYLSNAVQIQVLQAPTTTALAKAFIKKARTAFLNFQTPSNNFNAWKKVGGYGRAIETLTDPNDIVFLVRNDIRSEIDVEALATAFNMDKTTLLGNIKPVDDFNIYDRKTGKLLFDGSKILGLIADRKWFRIKKQDVYMDDFKNANNRSINYFLNAIYMYKYSFFANAICFATEEPSIPITSLDFQAPAGITLHQTGDIEGLDITVTPGSANTPKISYESDNDGIFIVDIDPDNDRHCIITATGEGTANLTAKAGNVSTTVSVTVESVQA